MAVARRISERLNIRKRWRFWLGMVLSLVALGWLVVTTDWAEAWLALTAANYWLVLAAVGLNLVSIPLRSLRWRLMFQPFRRPAFKSLTSIMLIGQAINVFAPFRLGDVVRASLVETENAAYVMGTQVLRIAMDLFILAALVLLLLFQVQLPAWWRGPGELLVMTSVVILLLLIGVVFARAFFVNLINGLAWRWPFSRGRGLFGAVGEFLRSLDIFDRPTTILQLTGLTILIWVFYTAVNTVLLGAVGSGYSMLAALFLLVVLQLGVAVPSSPGRVGVYHYLAVQALSVFDIDRGTAVSYAILLHLISVILPAGIGAILAWQSGLGRQTPQMGEGAEIVQ